MDTEVGVLAVNAEFYRAFTERDITSMGVRAHLSHAIHAIATRLFVSVSMHTAQHLDHCTSLDLVYRRCGSIMMLPTLHARTRATRRSLDTNRSALALLRASVATRMM